MSPSPFCAIIVFVRCRTVPARKARAGKESQMNNKEKKEAAASKEKPTLMQEIISWVEVIVTAVVIALLLTQFIIINARVPSGSMQDTIQPGDRLFGLRLTYLFSEPKRGDIVVFRYPVDDALGHKTNYIKRIIGLPGETLEIRDARIYINGSDTPLDEPYLREEWVERNDGITFKIPEGCYVMLGDNRNNSSDSRYWHDVALRDFMMEGKEITEEEAVQLQFVPRNKILGKAYVRYWPITQISVVK